MVTIETSPAQTIKLGQARVYVSNRLDSAASWTLVPYMFVVSLDIVAGPDIDECEFIVEYGRYVNFGGPGVIAPKDVLGKFVKVELHDSNGNVLQKTDANGNQVVDANDDPVPMDFAVWYGVIEVDERDVMGSIKSVVSGSPVDLPMGNQRIIAYGLLRELEKIPILSSVVENINGSYQTIGRGLPFNDFDGVAFSETANRSENHNGDYAGYIFSNDPIEGSKWDALEAVRYLLKFHAPVDYNGQPVCDWEITGETDSLTWYEISVPTDRRSVKDVIDDLIDRRRLVGYYVRGKETLNGDGDPVFSVEFQIFSFAESALSLPGGKTLAANPNQVDMDFEASYDIQPCILRNSVSHLADTIRVEGEPITSTCTVWVSDSLLGATWGSNPYADYLSGAGGDDEEANTIARTQDALRDVFALFGMDFQWNLQLSDHIYEDTYPAYYAVIRPEYFDDAMPDDIRTAFDVESAAGVQPGTMWIRGKRWLDYIPLKQEDGKDFRRPFCLFHTAGEALSIWERGDLLNANSSGGADDISRRFSVNLETVGKDMQIRLDCGMAGGQQLIAREHWAGANATPPALDPDQEENNAVEYEDMVITATFEWDSRLSYEVVINNNTGRPQRTTVIRVPNARLDWLIPGTVTDIDMDGELIVNDNGEILRDDRERIQQIGDAAAKWYGVERQALRLTYKQVTPLNIGIGWLITSVGANYSLANVNSPITAIRFALENEHTTTLETSYSSLDLL